MPTARPRKSFVYATAGQCQHETIRREPPIIAARRGSGEATLALLIGGAAVGETVCTDAPATKSAHSPTPPTPTTTTTNNNSAQQHRRASQHLELALAEYDITTVLELRRRSRPLPYHDGTRRA